MPEAPEEDGMKDGYKEQFSFNDDPGSIISALCFLDDTSWSPIQILLRLVMISYLQGNQTP